MTRFAVILGVLAVIAMNLAALSAQPPRKNRRPPPWYIEPTPETLRKVEQLIGKVHDVELSVSVQPNVSRLITTKRPIIRISITDPSILDVVQYSPTQFELIGLKRGVTSMSIWYGSSVKTSTAKTPTTSPPTGPAHVRKPPILSP